MATPNTPWSQYRRSGPQEEAELIIDDDGSDERVTVEMGGEPVKLLIRLSKF